MKVLPVQFQSLWIQKEQMPSTWIKLDMQNDVHILSQWAKTWQISFSADKRKVLQIGYKKEESVLLNEWCRAIEYI